MKHHGLIVLAAACLASGAARADDLQGKVLAAARPAPADAFAFRRTIALEQTGQARRIIVEAFDPRKPATDRWSLLSIDGRPPSEKELKDARKAKRQPSPGYAEQIKWFGAPATRTDGAPGTVIYRFASLPKGALKIGSHDASAATQAEVRVNTKGRIPFVEHVRMTTNKAFSMMLVASVKSVVVTYSYALLDDGHVLLTETTSNIAGSMLGKSGELRTHVNIGDYRPIN